MRLVNKKRTLREERAGQPSAERSETGGRNAPQKRNALRLSGIHDKIGGKVAEGDRAATRERPRSAHAPRRTRGARSRFRGDEAPHGDSRMRAAGADARRTAASPRTARKRAIEAVGRNSRSEAEAYARRDEFDQRSPTRRASGPQRGGPTAGRGEFGRTAADLAVAARPSGRPSRPPGGGSTVAPKRAARRQATGRARRANLRQLSRRERRIAQAAGV